MISKENELQFQSEKFNEKWETTMKAKINEIDSSQRIIDDQNHLISSYEKIIGKDKTEANEKIMSSQALINQLQEEVEDLTSVILNKIANKYELYRKMNIYMQSCKIAKMSYCIFKMR